MSMELFKSESRSSN